MSRESMTKRTADAAFAEYYGFNYAAYPQQHAAPYQATPIVGNNIPIGYNQGQYVAPSQRFARVQMRAAGGQQWVDPSLTDWDPNDFRIFCGDLGKDVTDDVLSRAFSKYSSFCKAKVIRDKATGKTRGYGFVSFKDPEDFTGALRDMNGKYVGSRPIKLRKSNWKDRSADVRLKKEKEEGKSFKLPPVIKKKRK